MPNFLKPSEIQTQYFKILKSIKPTININDKNSDFVIRGNVISGVVSGLYGDQQKVDNDSFIASMRPEALTLKGADLGIPQLGATYSVGVQIRVPGTNGTAIAPGALTFLYVPTNVIYTNTTGGVIAGGFLDVSIQSETVGQIGNVAFPDNLTIVSPPSGVGPVAALQQSISDGADPESTDSYRARLLSREQSPPAGGNETDYPLFAFAADPSVRSAFIRRFGRGLGTVDIYITTGSTDIDTAVTNGQSIVRIPGSGVIATVQAYYDSHVPLTDMPRVYAPVEVAVPVTVNVALASGLTLSSVPADPTYNPLNLTVAQLIQREVSRVLYKQGVGGRIIPGLTGGFIVAADIEESLDVWLSAVKDPVTGLVQGKIPVLADRQVQKLNGVNWNYPLTQNQLASPGVITTVVGV
jgi:uncharacterized phage protein gp47/JayE